MSAASLDGGFADPPRDAAHAFRAIMTAMARPGEINQINGVTPPAPLSVAAGCTILTLCDPDTPLYLAPPLDTPDFRRWIAFHTGAPMAGPEQATFAVGPWNNLKLQDFPVGTPDYPDRSTTLIVEVDALSPDGAILTGPGIETEARLSLPETAFFRQNAARFPLGLDTILTCGTRLAAIPRSTRVTEVA